MRRRPRNGSRARSVQEPSQDSSAGTNVSAPTTATPTTVMAPNAMPVKTGTPVRNSPATAIITVRPEITIARPDVPAAIRTASATVAPLARSSRSRRR